jgi:hypothetical protein
VDRAGVPRLDRATVFWWSVWALAAGAVLVWRVGLPLWRNARHRLHVTAVVPEAAGVVSVHLTGRHLDRLPAQAGQFLTWRFLHRQGWTRGNPYSLSAAPDGRGLRITVKELGDNSAQLRALAEGMEYAPGDAVLLHRFTDRPLFERELHQLTIKRGLQVLWLPGPGGHPTPGSGPAPAGVASVTVVAASLTWADIDATAAYAHGRDAARWLRTRPGRSGLVVWSDGSTTLVDGARRPTRRDRRSLAVGAGLAGQDHLGGRVSAHPEALGDLVRAHPLFAVDQREILLGLGPGAAGLRRAGRPADRPGRRPEAGSPRG